MQLGATCDWKHTVPEKGGCVTIVQSVSVPLHAVANLVELVECCFTSTETVGLLGTGAQDGHLDFHTAHEL